MDEKEFIDEINDEIKNLERLEKEMNSLLSDIEEEPTFIEIRACASILQDFYSGMEKTFERIALIVDNNLPEGETWHIDLLTQMAKSLVTVRPKVIAEGLFEKLKEYLKLRHLVRHIYGFEMKWERMKPLALSMSSVLDEFKENIREFMDFIESRKEEQDEK
jgi:hypothetical protein